MNRYRKTVAEIHLDNLYSNYKAVSEIIPDKVVIPVVKANAYGHGAVEVVRHLLSKGVNFFAVSLIEEADQLRKEFNDIELLIMGIVHKEEFTHCAENNYTITISNIDQVDGCMELYSLLKVHLKVDTGMNRLGFKDMNEIKDVVGFLDSHQFVNLQGIYTHFATADGDLQYYEKQRTQFETILNELDYTFEMIHCSNSSSSIKFEKDMGYTTHTRLGISLYGLSLDHGMEFLQNTFKLISQFQEIKHLKKGEKVGYGITYTAKEDETIGILPLGYADGFIRKNQGGDVEINNKRYEIVGRICMDQLFIKIDDSITKEDTVVLMGGLVSIDEVAERLDTINYEIICSITYRVPKIYIRKE
jgi:alanine racemase